MSNTSKGRANKGSKFWTQTLVNLDNGNALTKEIQKIDSSVGEITWLSPLAESQYEEYKLNSTKMSQQLGIKREDMRFWPKNQPQWDAIGIVKNTGDEKDTIILVEAKAHISEINNPCTAKDDDSKILIENSLRGTHKKLSSCNYFDRELWLGTYYQLGNRFTFLHKLRESGYSVKLILLNFVNDPTHVPTLEKEWKEHYDNVFSAMLGSSEPPKDVIVVNMKI